MLHYYAEVKVRKLNYSNETKRAEVICIREFCVFPLNYTTQVAYLWLWYEYSLEVAVIMKETTLNFSEQ